jgi:1-acyl-sn-glycerol-3-phosphate acyltransferase
MTQLVAVTRRALPNLRLYERAGRLARSQRGLVIAFTWGVLEAIVSPIVPDYLVAMLSAAAPERFLLLAALATAGSIAGGAVAFAIGAAGAGNEVLAHAPLVTTRMELYARAWLHEDGAFSLMKQPLSGVPYKVFALQAAAAPVKFGSFVTMTLIARGLRLVAVAVIFAGWGYLVRRWLPRVFGLFLVIYTIAFALGLVRVVEAWS